MGSSGFFGNDSGAHSVGDWSLWRSNGYFINNRCSYIFLVMQFLLPTESLLNNTFCPNNEDYSPCHCFFGLSVRCANIPVNEVAMFFKNNEGRERRQQMTFFILMIPPEDDAIIPADFLADQWITSTIEISCLSYKKAIEIDPNAFRLSRNFTQGLNMFSCDIAGLDFLFLSHFINIERLFFDSVVNLQMVNWTSLKYLPGLHYVKITGSLGLDDCHTPFPFLSNELLAISLTKNFICKEAMERILDWIINSTAIKSLQMLEVHTNSYIGEPLQISMLRHTFPNISIVDAPDYGGY